jgi:HEAT repeat protein
VTLGSYSALAIAVLLWTALSVWLLVDRAIHDRRWRTLELAWRRLRPAPGAATGGSPVRAILERVPRRTIERHAADQATPIWVAQALAEHALERDPRRLLREAASHRGERGRWRRIAALHILCRSGHADLLPVLRRALRDADRDVAGAAISLLGAVPQPEAAALLVTALRERLYPQSRVAARLDRFPIEVAEVIAPLILDPDPGARFWGASLLARYGRRPGVTSALAHLAADADPSVRKAAIESLGHIGGTVAEETARRLLADPVWFVRAHAARALGDLGRRDLAREIALLLADDQWWVRAAAKDALQAMGPGVAPVVAALLDHPDRFARNGASEVLQNLGVLDDLATRAAQGSGEGDVGLLRKAAAAGGPVLAEGIVARSAPALSERVRTLLAGGEETASA